MGVKQPGTGDQKERGGGEEVSFGDSVEEGGSDSGGDGDGGGGSGMGARGRGKRAVRPVKPRCGIEY